MVLVALVDRATSSTLFDPDWSINLEICDILNSDPGQTKEVVRLLKKKLHSKHSKVQLLALTLLETLVKNCGDVVHMHVAEKDILHEMVKLVKKKPDFHVKEKTLVLIDTWQEAFGGPRARYPQYYAAYQELLHSGVVFPLKPEGSVPIFTPPQTKPLSYSQPVRKPVFSGAAPESSTRSDFPSLSLSEIHNARGIVDILAEMLSALDPANKEGLKQEVVVDLVEQCRSYKRHVFELVNTTSDEKLLLQGLALHDDLQRVLAQRDAIASGIAVKVEKQESVADIPKIDIKTCDPVIPPNGKMNSGTADTSSSHALQQLPPVPPSNGSVASSTRAPQIDLLSGDFHPPENENPLALVPVSIYSETSTSDQNALALRDVFAQHTTMETQPSISVNPYSVPKAFTTSSNIEMTQTQRLKGMNPVIPQLVGSQQILSNHQTWNTYGANVQQLKPLNLGVGNNRSEEVLPPPPWEMQQVDAIQPGLNGSTPVQQPQVVQMGGIYPQQLQQSPRYLSTAHMAGAIPYQSNHMQGTPVLASQVQATQMPGGGYIYERWIIPQPDAQYYDQMRSQHPYLHPQSTANNLSPRMYGSQITSSSRNLNPSHQNSSPDLSSMQSTRLSKPEDKLFSDLVDFSKLKPNKRAM